jgi:hypothetical protein
MRQPDDKKTLDVCEMDLAGPVPAKPTSKELAKARAAKFKEKHNVAALTIHLPVDQLAAFEAYCLAKDRKKSAVISKLLETQLLRKR